MTMRTNRELMGELNRELADLTARISRGKAALPSVYENVDAHSGFLLSRQLMAMEEYARALGARIDHAQHLAEEEEAAKAAGQFNA